MAKIKMGNRGYDLQGIPVLNKINKINTVEDLGHLADFVYITISHAMDTGLDLKYNVAEMYWRFINKKTFGWCYMHAIYMHILLQEYNRKSYLYDYGLQKEQLTHSVVVVTLKDKQYLIDPYFNRYYTTKKGEPLTFQKLLIESSRESKEIITVYGKGKKSVRQGNNFVEWTPQEFLDSVMASWKKNQNYDEVMMAKFNSTNPFLLIPQKIQKVVVLQKIDGSKYYEFF